MSGSSSESELEMLVDIVVAAINAMPFDQSAEDALMQADDELWLEYSAMMAEEQRLFEEREEMFGEREDDSWTLGCLRSKGW